MIEYLGNCDVCEKRIFRKKKRRKKSFMHVERERFVWVNQTMNESNAFSMKEIEFPVFCERNSLLKIRNSVSSDQNAFGSFIVRLIENFFSPCSGEPFSTLFITASGFFSLFRSFFNIPSTLIRHICKITKRVEWHSSNTTFPCTSLWELIRWYRCILPRDKYPSVNLKNEPCRTKKFN